MWFIVYSVRLFFQLLKNQTEVTAILKSGYHDHYLKYVFFYLEHVAGLLIKRQDNYDWENNDVCDDQESDLLGPVVDGEAGDGVGKSSKLGVLN